MRSHHSSEAPHLSVGVAHWANSHEKKHFRNLFKETGLLLPSCFTLILSVLSVSLGFIAPCRSLWFTHCSCKWTTASTSVGSVNLCIWIDTKNKVCDWTLPQGGLQVVAFLCSFLLPWLYRWLLRSTFTEEGEWRRSISRYQSAPLALSADKRKIVVPPTTWFRSHKAQLLVLPCRNMSL